MSATAPASGGSDILDTICQQRGLDVASAKEKVPVEELIARRDSKYSPDSIRTILDVCKQGAPGGMVAAEFKRASPSKSDIALGLDVAEQTLKYARGGATVLSVLTEPKWFKGSLVDLELARQSSEAALGKSRPCMLRKDFIIDTYQIAEAAAFGADCVLLIVSWLRTADKVKPLIEYSRSLGIEPLVEVHTEDEADVALASGAKVIGVNNRNLKTFKVDLGTTGRIAAHLARSPGCNLARNKGEDGIHVISLSGIRSADDFGDVLGSAEGQPVRGILVGEHLMRASDPTEEVAGLLRGVSEKLRAASVSRDGGGTDAAAAEVAAAAAAARESASLCKVCGVRREEDAMAVATSGSDLLGLVFATKSPRCVTVEQAAAIASKVRAYREQDPAPLLRTARGWASHALRGDAAAVGVLAADSPGASSGAAAGGASAGAGAGAGSSSGGAAAAASLSSTDMAAAATAMLAWQHGIQRASARARPLVVGVFAGRTPEQIAAAWAGSSIDVVQLHGGEGPDQISETARYIEEAAKSRGVVDPVVPLISVLHVPARASGAGAGVGADEGKGGTEARAEDIARECVARVRAGAAMVLLDTKVKGGPEGGSGVTFDWAVAAAAQRILGARLGVAGGLDADTVGGCIADVKPAFVDVASGVEAEEKEEGTGLPMKDHGKVKAFVKAAKRS